MGEVKSEKVFFTLNELLEDLDREGIYGARRTKAVDYFLRLQARSKGIPFSGGFELTPLCNFNCKMCYVHLNQAQMGNRKLLTVDQWKSIMQQAIDAGMMEADLTGGECLTYPGFKEIYLFLLSKGIRVSILTNGQLLSQDMVDFFRFYKPACIQISLYGSSESAYEMVTGCRAFKDVIDAVHRLKDASIKTKLAITVERYMVDDAINMIHVARSLGVEYEVGAIQLDARPETGRKLSDYSTNADIILKIRQMEDNYHGTDDHQAEDIKPYSFKMGGLKNEAGFPCGAGRSGFHVNWKGELVPCIAFYAVREPLENTDFLTAWNNIRKRIALYMPPSECRSCQYREECNTCAGEKTFGILNGPLNRAVCERMRVISKNSQS